MQLAWLPADFDAALAHWTQTMGVGPFFLFENIALADARYRGEPTDVVFSIAIAYWGDMQIELVRAEDDAPSIYNGSYAVTDRMHHMCVLTDDLAVARHHCAAVGAVIQMEGRVGDDGGVLYVDPGTGPGGLVEILKPAHGTAAMFSTMREAAQNWNGREPLRRLG